MMVLFVAATALAPRLVAAPPRADVRASAACDSIAPLPGPACAIPQGLQLEVELEDAGVVLQVAQSLVAPGELGLFAKCAPGKERAIIESGQVLCGYCADALLVSAIEGDKAVPFHFPDAQMLVMYNNELRPLQAAIAESKASQMYGHTVRRYGHNQIGVMVTPDGATTRRFLVPKAAAAEAGGVAALDSESLAQFCNDLAFSPGVIERNDAMVAYDAASDAANTLLLVWRVMPCEQELGAEGESIGQVVTSLQPESVCAVATRDTRLERSAGSVELGCRYGLDFWRQRRAARLADTAARKGVVLRGGQGPARRRGRLSGLGARGGSRNS